MAQLGSTLHVSVSASRIVVLKDNLQSMSLVDLSAALATLRKIV